MKVTVTTLYGKVVEVDIDNSTTIRDFRFMLSRSFNNKVWTELTPSISINDEYRLIYCEADPDITLLQFIKQAFNNATVTLDDVKFGIMENNDGNYKRTLHNPQGDGVAFNLSEYNLSKDKHKAFFNVIQTPTPKTNFLNRLKSLGFPENLIPSRFICKNTGEFLTDPYLAADQNTYNRQYLLSTAGAPELLRPNIALYSKLKLFVDAVTTLKSETTLTGLYFLKENLKSPLINEYLTIFLWAKEGAAFNAILPPLTSSLLAMQFEKHDQQSFRNTFLYTFISSLTPSMKATLKQHNVSFSGAIDYEMMRIHCGLDNVFNKSVELVHLGADMRLRKLYNAPFSLEEQSKLLEIYIDKRSKSPEQNELSEIVYISSPPVTNAPSKRVNVLISLLYNELRCDGSPLYMPDYIKKLNLFKDLSLEEVTYLIPQLIKVLTSKECYHLIYELALHHNVTFAANQGAIVDLFKWGTTRATFPIAEYLMRHGEVVDYDQLSFVSVIDKIELMKLHAKTIVQSQRPFRDKITALMDLAEIMNREYDKAGFWTRVRTGFGYNRKSDMVFMSTLIVSTLTNTFKNTENLCKSGTIDTPTQIAAYQFVRNTVRNVKQHKLITDNSSIFNPFFGYLQISSSQLDALDTQIVNKIEQFETKATPIKDNYIAPSVNRQAPPIQVPEKAEQRFTALAATPVQVPVRNPYYNHASCLYPSTLVNPPTTKEEQHFTVRAPVAPIRVSAPIQRPLPAVAVPAPVPVPVSKPVVSILQKKPEVQKASATPSAQVVAPKRNYSVGIFHNLSQIFWPRAPEEAPSIAKTAVPQPL